MINVYSTLMHAMIVGAKPTPISQAFQYSHYRAFGELVFEQLAELRHRGAFSTVSQTFAECCLRCAQSDDPRTQALPKEWYQVGFLDSCMATDSCKSRKRFYASNNGVRH